MSGRALRRRGVAGVLLLALALALALAGCTGAPTPDASMAPGGTAPPPVTTRTTDGPPALDPAMAVDPPGPRAGRLWTADLLVVSTEALGAATVRDITRLPGVEKVLAMSLAQVTIENRALDLAAVDPAEYRLFTRPNVADSQQVWDRVARGELAIRPRLGKRLADGDEMITLGSGDDAPRLHVGAYAPQITGVDAVINDQWGERLAMPDNALLVSVGLLTSPGALRPTLERIAGREASVQSLDAVARYGLDTSVRQTAVFTGGSIASVVGTFQYAVVPGGGGRIDPDPAWVSSHISTRVMPIIGPMTCNTALFPQLQAALQEIVDRGLADRIHPGEYAGCFYPRFIAGTTTLSNHSFGLAFDVNVPGNQRGTAGDIDRTVVSILEAWGFAWGGTWRYTDPMHFELSRIVEPR